MRFIEMNKEELEKYIEFEINDYAEVLSSKRGNNKEQALKNARKSTEEILNKQDLENYMVNIIDDDSHEIVGYMWYYRCKKEGKFEVFLASINILKGYRGKGYGRKAMNLLEDRAKELNAHKIKLHVFGYNRIARELYESLGFEPYSINMEKIL